MIMFYGKRVCADIVQVTNQVTLKWGNFIDGLTYSHGPFTSKEFSADGNRRESQRDPKHEKDSIEGGSSWLRKRCHGERA
jgi:hypothetical protein